MKENVKKTEQIVGLKSVAFEHKEGAWKVSAALSVNFVIFLIVPRDIGNFHQILIIIEM